jgi:hypothetical protein
MKSRFRTGANPEVRTFYLAACGLTKTMALGLYKYSGARSRQARTIRLERTRFLIKKSDM